MLYDPQGPEEKRASIFERKAPIPGRVAQRGTCHGMNLHFPRVRLEEGRKSFSYFGPKLCNDLPEKVKAVDSYMLLVPQFKINKYVKCGGEKLRVVQGTKHCINQITNIT